MNRRVVFLFSFLFLAIAFLLHTQIKTASRSFGHTEEEFERRGLLLAQSSFELGCIRQGQRYCFADYSSDDSSTLARGYCLEDVNRICPVLAEEYRGRLAAGKPK